MVLLLAAGVVQTVRVGGNDGGEVDYNSFFFAVVEEEGDYYLKKNNYYLK